jgi:multidrug resistance efflux pump
MFTPYLEATGNTASINTVKLVARVEGYVQEIKYQDGAAVKKDTPLFVIEPQPYKVQRAGTSGGGGGQGDAGQCPG